MAFSHNVRPHGTVEPHLLAQIDPFSLALVRQAAHVALASGASLWLVGGVVRDLLLGLPIERDLDLAVEGDAIALAHALAQEMDGTVTATHQAFGTATIAYTRPGSLLPFFLDLATTRVESYAHPADLPTVQPAPITHDLARRDFSINAMAIEIRAISAGVELGIFLDPYGGMHDLRSGLLRVLHNQSFDDDPTRILRGVRLASRLSMHMEPHTRQLLANALQQGRMEATSPDRLRTELCLALAEPEPDDVLRRSDDLGITPHLIAPLRWSKHLAARFKQARKHPIPAPIRSLRSAGLLTYDLLAEEREHVIAHYRLPGEFARLLRDVAVAQSVAHQPPHPNSELDTTLRRLHRVALDVVCCAEPPAVAQMIQRYIAAQDTATPLLDGHALQRMGIDPGPQVGRILRGLRAARLDGHITTRIEEEAWVSQHKNNME